MNSMKTRGLWISLLVMLPTFFAACFDSPKSESSKPREPTGGEEGEWINGTLVETFSLRFTNTFFPVGYRNSGQNAVIIQSDEEFTVHEAWANVTWTPKWEDSKTLVMKARLHADIQNNHIRQHQDWEWGPSPSPLHGNVSNVSIKVGDSPSTLSFALRVGNDPGVAFTMDQEATMRVFVNYTARVEPILYASSSGFRS